MMDVAELEKERGDNDMAGNGSGGKVNSEEQEQLI